MEVGDTWRGDGFDETKLYVIGEGLEEGSAAAEQDRHLMQDHLVDEPGLERLGQDTAAHETDVLVTGKLQGVR